MKNLNPSLKKVARGISSFFLFVFINFNLCAQTSSDEMTTGDKLVTALLIIVALAFISLIIYSVVKATKGEAIFYCGMGDYIIAMLPLVLLVIGIGILEWKPVFSIISIACAIFYNLFMSFSLNRGKMLNQIVIFMGRMTVGYLSIAMLVVGVLMLITMLFGGPGKGTDETYQEHRARKAKYAATGAGLSVGGALLIKKLINSQPADLTEKQRGLTVLGKATAFVLMLGCFGGWYFIDSSKVTPVQAAQLGQTTEVTSSKNINSAESSAVGASALEEANRNTEENERIAEENKRIEKENMRITEETKRNEEEVLKQKEEADALKVKTFFENGIEKANKDFSENIVNLNDSYYYLSDGSLNGKFYIIEAKGLEIQTKGGVPQDIYYQESDKYKIEKTFNSFFDGQATFAFKHFRFKEIPKKFIDRRKNEEGIKVYYVDASDKIYKYINVLPWYNLEETEIESDTLNIIFNFRETNGIWESTNLENRNLSNAGIEVSKLHL